MLYKQTNYYIFYMIAYECKPANHATNSSIRHSITLIIRIKY